MKDLDLRYVTWENLRAGGFYLCATVDAGGKPCFWQIIRGADAYLKNMCEHLFYELPMHKLS